MSLEDGLNAIIIKKSSQKRSDVHNFFLGTFPSNNHVIVEFQFTTPTTGSSDLPFCSIQFAESWKTTQIKFQHLFENAHTYQQTASNVLY